MRQPDFSTALRRARVPTWQWLALGACALVALLALAQALAAREEARAAALRLAEVGREVDAAAARRDALVARMRAATGSALAAEDVPPSRVVASLAELLPRDVRLERLSIDYRRGGELELLVVARDAAAWDRLLQRLEEAPRLRDVEPGPEARTGEVRSLVQARWAAAGPR
jgi:hypothetical protein